MNASIPSEQSASCAIGRCAPTNDAPSSAAVEAAAWQLRKAVDRASRPAESLARSLGEAFARWRDRDFAPRQRTLAMAIENSGLSRQLLDESLDALLEPFNRQALAALAARIRQSPELFGFILPGNVMGGGLHEVVQALLAGAGALIKTASTEPFFFSAFAETLSEIDSELFGRICVMNWSRLEDQLTRSMIENCDLMIALGSDETIDALAAPGGQVAFGSRMSGALIARESATGANLKRISKMLAHDVALFEQLGCLSPHHIFVESGTAPSGHDLALAMAQAFDSLTIVMPPPSSLSASAASAIRRFRETARWRALAGEPVELWEGARLAWTVVHDHGASFCLSPGYRTVCVSAVADLSEFVKRLTPVVGKIEAFALDDPLGRLDQWADWLRSTGVSYVCQPGRMQSPPLDWRHGGGIFLDHLLLSR